MSQNRKKKKNHVKENLFLFLGFNNEDDVIFRFEQNFHGLLRLNAFIFLICISCVVEWSKALAKASNLCTTRKDEFIQAAC